MNSFHRLLFSLLSAAAVLVAGCGQSEPAASIPAAAPAAGGVRVVEITANDAMKFSVTEIRATPGEKLRISLANVGRMPKQTMAHNWVLLTPRPDADVMAWGMAAASKAPTYLPDDQTGVLAHTKLLGPGEKDQVELTAPATAGEYPFLCTFPGHVALMKGKLIVN
jgi:azurin